MNVRSAPSNELWSGFDRKLVDLIHELSPEIVCDIGGGRNPQLSLEQVAELGVEYTVLDISQQELDLAASGYDKVCGDIGSPDLAIEEAFDLMFSRMVAEHVGDGEAFHRNVYSSLRPGGHAFHFFPTLFTIPFAVNKVIPEALSDRLLDVVSPRDRSTAEKFPAVYSWTRGPTKHQIERLESIGFEVVEYVGGFGHNYYRRIPVLRTIHDSWAKHLVAHPRYGLTSYSYLLLRRPEHGQP